MTRIVTSHYRYKSPPRKRKPGAPLEVPRIVTVRDRKRAAAEKVSPDSAPQPTTNKRAGASAPPAPAANDDPKPAVVSTKPPKPTPPPATEAHPSAIVTARRPGKRYADVPEVSEEEHRRVGDLADATMQEFKRVIAEKARS